jgi:solute:Na+ symporter, SSS family
VGVGIQCRTRRWAVAGEPGAPAEGKAVLTTVDYVVIGFYLVFMFALGPIYKSFSKTASDFFRGGGGMLWWVVGASTFMTTFTAWSFTGGAGKAYETGTFFLLLFACNMVGLVFTYFFTAARFRQMRVITYVEAVYKRYGGLNEQVFAWLPVPTQVLFGGIGLYAISVFMAGVFQVPMAAVIITIGVVVTLMTLFGGSWAATAGDFVQMLVVMAATVTLSVLVLAHEQVGGLTGLIRQVPPAHFRWTDFDRVGVILLFAITLLINQTVQNNSLQTGAAKYIFVKTGKDARKAVLISMAGFLLLSPIWILPAMAATIFHPNLAAEYPALNNPSEAAYVAMAIDMLPPGMLGLLVCAIFAASITSMNSGLNMVSGIFVRNVWIRLIDRECSEARQILVGRVVILLYGILWVLVGLMFAQYKELSLFDLILTVAACIGIPTTIPLFFGIFVKRTPDWSAWSTMAIGFVAALWLRLGNRIDRVTETFWGWLGLYEPTRAWFDTGIPLNAQEAGDTNIALTTAILFLLCTGWYFFTMLFARKDTGEEQHADAFFREMNTPIDPAEEHVPAYDNDARQYGVLANLCLIYGGFILALLLLPNEKTGYICLLACGGGIMLVGLLLRWIGARVRRKGTADAIMAAGG